MSPEVQAPVEVLDSTSPTPIAQLHPDIDNAESRVLDGVITVTWPYSILTKSIAFVLAERDFRLRSQTGQLRLELHGAAGKALADSGVGAGDELRISLGGAQWGEPEAQIRLPKGSLKWQLKYSNRLLLRFSKVESQERDVIRVDAPEEQQSSPAPVDPPLGTRPSPPPPETELPHEHATPRVPGIGGKRPASSVFEQDEFASPAFLKRARVSYGSLFEGDIDSLDENTEGKRKKRRRSRFSMGFTPWRYNSAHSTPERIAESSKQSDHDVEQPTSGDESTAASPTKRAKVTPSNPIMVDEGCQTCDLDFSPDTNARLSPDSHLAESVTWKSAWQTPTRALFGAGKDRPGAARSGTEQTDGYTTLPFGMQLAPQPNHYDSPQPFGATSSPQDTTDAMHPVQNPEISHAMPEHDSFTSRGLQIDPTLQLSQAHETHHPYYMPEGARMAWQDPAHVAAYPQMNFSDIPNPSATAADHASLLVHGNDNVESGDSDASAYDGPTPTNQDRQELQEDGFVESTEAEGINQEIPDEEQFDGGDIPGEDYDLRNYDRARDDDDDDMESADEVESEGTDPDDAVINTSDEDENSQDDDFDDTHEEGDHQSAMHDNDETGSSGSQSSEQDDDSEEGSYNYGYHYEYGPVESAPQEPVFIDLVSDDDEEAEASGTAPKTLSSVTQTSEQHSKVDAEIIMNEDDGTKRQHPTNMAKDNTSTERDGSKESDDFELDEAAEEPESSIESEEDSASDAESSHEQIQAEPTSELDDERIAAESTNSNETEHEKSIAGAAQDGDVRSPRAPQTDPDTTRANDTYDSRADGERKTSVKLDDAKDALTSGTEQPASETALVDRSEATGQSEQAETESKEKLMSETEACVPRHSGGVESAIAMSMDDLFGSNDQSAMSSEEDDHSIEDPSECMEKQDLSMQSEDETDGDYDATDGDQGSPRACRAGRADKESHELGDEVEAEEQGLVDTARENGTGIQGGVLMGDASLHPPREAIDVHEAQDPVVTSENTDMEESQASRDSTGVQTSTEAISISKTVEATVSQGINGEETASGQDESEKVTLMATESHEADEDSVMAEAQIMAEFIGWQKASNTASDGSSGLVELPLPTKLDEEDGRVTVPCLPRSHRNNDPSILLARNDEQAYSEGSARDDVSVSPLVMPTAGARDWSKDPSLLLADADVLENRDSEKAERERASPHLMLTTGTRDWSKDPSLLLVNADASEGGDIDDAERVPVSPQMMLVKGTRDWSKDPSLVLAKADGTEGPTEEAPTTPTTPTTPRVTRSMASQADTVTTSPSISGSITDNEDVSKLHKELQTMHQTSLPDLVLLRSLRTRLLKKTVDVMAICTHNPRQPHRPKHGPRDYMLELVLTDSSTMLSSVSVAQIYRPHQASLPVVNAGDVVLLRQMQVVSIKGHGCGVRAGDGSAWAVFEKDDKEQLPQIKGPPVEVTKAEADYAQLLGRWWAMQDGRARATVEKATRRVIEAAAKDDAK